MVKKTIKKISTQKEDSIVSPKLVKGCYFCQNKTAPLYTDTVTLKKFISERSRILPKTSTHLCSKHQRRVTKQIKYARHLALLPFTSEI